MNEKLLDYAVVENGIITNVLVFADEKTAKDFGCLPLSPTQGIGDSYLSPEEYERNRLKAIITEPLNLL